MKKLLLIILMLCLPALIAAQTQPKKTTSLTINGAITDAATGESIAFATVRVRGTGISTLTNETGQYHLRLQPGTYTVTYSHIGFYSNQTTIELTDTDITNDVNLQPTLIEIRGISVYEKPYDAAQRIIVEAIRRKKNILSQLHDYEYDAYTKVVVEDIEDPDSSKILLIAESQTTAYWEQPDKFKEIISARKQTANIPAEGNLVTVGEFLNFNKNRLEVADLSIVSPTANDALDYYNYYLLDTLYIDSQAVFVLEIEPKSPANPLFFGEIHIADSTYDVVKVDVGYNNAVRLPMIDSVRYSQRLAQFEGAYWMPIEIRFSALISIDAPLPGIPSRLSISQSASIYEYSFEKGHEKGTFDEYEVVVLDDADDFDSLVWNDRQTIPLTAAEEYGYHRIDSVENAPKQIGKMLLMGLGGAMALMMFGDDDLFHYNRVEGPYAGLGLDFRFASPIGQTNVWTSTGYSFEQEKWYGRAGFENELWHKRRLVLGVEYRDKIARRSTLFAGPGYNATFGALFYGADPFDYYHEKGFSIWTGLKPIDHFRLTAAYRDYRQYSMITATRYNFFAEDSDVHDNLAITDGHLRSVEAQLRYDSRRLIDNKGRDLIMDSHRYTVISASVEHASPDVIDNDFDFTRYSARLFRRQRLFGLGMTSAQIDWGDADGSLPRQRWFVANHSDPVFFGEMGFKTLDENNYEGSEVLSVYLSHEFGQRLFKRSGLPLIKDIPFELGVHGGAFWSDFNGPDDFHSDGSIRSAGHAYSELGFSLSNLTPFLSPFNFALGFTWQLSDYDTTDWSIQLGLRL